MTLALVEKKIVPFPFLSFYVKIKLHTSAVSTEILLVTNLTRHVRQFSNQLTLFFLIISTIMPNTRLVT